MGSLFILQLFSLCTAYSKTAIKNIGHRWVKKDISILKQKTGIFTPKGDDLELFHWCIHFKSHFGSTRIDCFEWEKNFRIHALKWSSWSMRRAYDFLVLN